MIKKIMFIVAICGYQSVFAFGIRFGLMTQMINSSGGIITYTDSFGLNPRSTNPSRRIYRSYF